MARRTLYNFMIKLFFSLWSFSGSMAVYAYIHFLPLCWVYAFLCVPFSAFFLNLFLCFVLDTSTSFLRFFFKQRHFNFRWFFYSNKVFFSSIFVCVFVAFFRFLVYYAFFVNFFYFVDWIICWFCFSLRVCGSLSVVVALFCFFPSFLLL